MVIKRGINKLIKELYPDTAVECEKCKKVFISERALRNHDCFIKHPVGRCKKCGDFFMNIKNHKCKE